MPQTAPMTQSGRPEVPPTNAWTRLWQPFWALPAAIAAASLVLGLVLPRLDEDFEPFPGVFSAELEVASDVLTTIAGAMISVTGVVFSVTMVILQLASSQFTPRVLGTFLESRVTQATLGVFAGSFVYALTVLRGLDGTADVPETAVALAYLYVIVAVALFVAFIRHITASVQVSQVMVRVRRRTLAVVEDVVPTEHEPALGWSPRPGTPRVDLRTPGRCGYVTTIDSTRLAARARELDVVVELLERPGTFIADGSVVGRVWGREDLDGDDLKRLAATVRIADDRDFVADPAFGIRQLLDIAERALSPGVNDPTTAIQALDQVHVVLRVLAGRPDLTPYLLDEEGEVRALYRPHTFAGHVRTVTTEVLHYGADAVRIVPHLRAMLRDVAEGARTEHQPALETALAEVEAALADQPSGPDIRID